MDVRGPDIVWMSSWGLYRGPGLPKFRWAVGRRGQQSLAQGLIYKPVNRWPQCLGDHTWWRQWDFKGLQSEGWRLLVQFAGSSYCWSNKADWSLLFLARGGSGVSSEGRLRLGPAGCLSESSLELAGPSSPSVQVFIRKHVVSQCLYIPPLPLSPCPVGF